MKTFRFLTLAVIALLAGGFLQSCSDDDDGPGNTKDLVGIWESAHCIEWEEVNGEVTYQHENDYDYGDGIRIKFNADGTFIDLYGSSWEEYGTYTYSGGKLSLNYDDDGSDIETYKVKTLNATTLVLVYSSKENEDGRVYEYYEEMTYRKISDE